MNLDARLAAARALVRLSSSSDRSDRADAGRSLANFVDVDEVRDSLVNLVLDGDDTFVTAETTAALLRRKDPAGLSILARACGSADAHQLDHVSDGLMDILWRPVDREPAQATCEALQTAPDDESMRVGAARLSEMLEHLTDLYQQMNPKRREN